MIITSLTNDDEVQALLMLGFNPSEQEVVDIPNEIARFDIGIIIVIVGITVSSSHL